MQDRIICFIDHLLAEAKYHDRFGEALTIFYSEVLQDKELETERKYCLDQMKKSDDMFLQGFCEALES